MASIAPVAPVAPVAPATNTHWPLGVAGAVASSFLWVLAFRLLSGAHQGAKSHLPKYTNPMWLSGTFVVLCATAATALALCFASGTLVHGMAALTMVGCCAVGGGMWLDWSVVAAAAHCSNGEEKKVAVETGCAWQQWIEWET